MKTVIVAARDIWPTEDAVAQIAALIAQTPPGSEIWIRAARGGLVASPLEQAAAILGDHSGRVVIQAVPEHASGRQGTFRRDARLVDLATRVIAFFHPGNVMGGGTGHVVYAAFQKGLAVEAWTLQDDGTLYQIASQDADIAELWDGFDRD